MLSQARLCHVCVKRGSGTRVLDLGIQKKVYENSRLSTNNRYLFTYLANRPKSPLHRVV